MQTLPLSPVPLRAVLADLRPADRAELAATLWEFDPAAIVEASAAARFGFVALAGDGQPVAACGAAELWPGCYQVGLFATTRWPEVAAAVTRRIRRDLIPALLAAGARRAQAMSDARHAEAHRWLRRLGARCEARLTAFGTGGEDFLLFAWTRATLPPRQGSSAARTPRRKWRGKGIA